jgi:hypothetical protein
MSLVYLIFAPTDTTLSLGGITSGFCGYHQHGKRGASGPDDNLFWATVQGYTKASSAQSFVDSISYCVSHELVETFTNRDGSGYYTDDGNGCEVGDLCEADTSGNVITVPYGRWQVERYWSNRQSGCVISPEFGVRVFEKATTFANETDGVWLMADYDRDGIPDLVFIKTGNPQTGTVEVHVASGASNYQTRILETGTTFLPETDGVWLMADYDRDGVPDLVFIKTGNPQTGTVEVHVASGASNYQTRILETGTAFLPETDGVWLMADYNRDGIPDLVFIKTSNTPNGHVEVHVAKGV